MIRIERKRVKPPEPLRSSKTKSARQRLETFFAEDPKSGMARQVINRFLQEIGQ
jgi:hypothetical protein